MGGTVSHEFMVPAQEGEDIVLNCPKCKFSQVQKTENDKMCPKCNVKLEKINTIEVGHIFQLGIKYSSVLGANFLDAQGKQREIIMGCYGIGVSRLISAVIAQNHDAQGIIWPKELSPYKAIILPLDITDKKIKKLALDIYKELEESGIEALFDDRDERAGVKFKDADLLGISSQVIIGKESLKKNKIELKIRSGNRRIMKSKEGILKEIKRFAYKG
jgi:prolyl-tRNA synthetase